MTTAVDVIAVNGEAHFLQCGRAALMAVLAGLVRSASVDCGAFW